VKLAKGFLLLANSALQPFDIRSYGTAKHENTPKP
jgi:hypothetical protein